MATQTSKSLDDFQVISREYDRKMQKTHLEMGQAWLQFMEDHRAPIAKRRREVLGVLMDLIPTWREMVDNAEVVLGCGSPLDHDPLYMIINKVNWPAPSPGDFTLVTKELISLMQRVGRLIDEDAKRSSHEAEVMEEMLAQYIYTFGKDEVGSGGVPPTEVCSSKMAGEHDSDDCEECVARL